MTSPSNFRERLKKEFASRIRRNARYSLRAFARDLGLQPARLSLILSGKKGLSRASALEIAKLLGLSARERDVFVSDVESQHARSKSARRAAIETLKAQHAELSARTLSADAFQVISDWHHLAIVEILKLEKSEHTAKWIAQQFDLSVLEATHALERLVRLEMIGVVPGSKPARYSVVPDTILAPDGVPSDAVKKFHEQVIRKAIDALYLQPVQERDFCAQISAIRSRDLPAIRAEVRKFFDRIETQFANAPDGDRIVCISNQVFNLSLITTKESL